jgi:hypothetical protein
MNNSSQENNSNKQSQTHHQAQNPISLFDKIQETFDSRDSNQ